MDINQYCQSQLDQLGHQGLRRGLKLQNGPQDRTIVVEGKEVLNFCSNNYLGLADDPRLRDAAVLSLDAEGFGAGASRLVCGNMVAHTQLEQTIAGFKGAERCLLFSTGYMANVGVISSLFGKDDLILSDRLNHASIIDGILLSGAKFKRYPHCDMEGLERLLSSAKGYAKKAIITDSVFSMDGDIAPLDKIVELARKYDSVVLIDEAHALGVVGKTGRGLAEHFGVEKDVDIHIGTLSKAAGSFGAYCCASASVIEYLVNTTRSFIYTTGMPPSVAAASQRAIEIIRDDKPLREQLWKNTHHTRVELKGLGFDTMYTTTPIIPILVKDTDLAVTFSRKLFERGILITAIRPPTVPANSARLRLTVMAKHTQDDIHLLLKGMGEVGKELKVI